MSVPKNKVEESSGFCCETDVKRLLQIAEVEVHTATTFHKTLDLCHSAWV